jgi:hypothetical protein
MVARECVGGWRHPVHALLEVAAEGLLAEDAVASVVGEVDASTHLKDHREEFDQKAPLPRADGGVVKVRRFCKIAAATGSCESMGCQVGSRERTTYDPLL